MISKIEEHNENKKVIALVGMAGSGKSDVAALLGEKGLPVIRFGEQTDIGLREKKLLNTEENERIYRVKLRQEMGMAAYAISAKPKIDQALLEYGTIILDGLYSWEEYVFLKQQYRQLIIVGIFADRQLRYNRLKKRSVRPLTGEQAEKRDIAEITDLHKAGPIVMADYVLENNGSIDDLKAKTEVLLKIFGFK